MARKDLFERELDAVDDAYIDEIKKMFVVLSDSPVARAEEARERFSYGLSALRAARAAAKTILAKEP